MQDYTTTVVVTPILVTDKAPSGGDNNAQYPQNNQQGNPNGQDAQGQYPKDNTNGKTIGQPAGTIPGFEFKFTVANGDTKTFRTAAADKETAKNQIVAELAAMSSATQSA